MNKKFFTKKGKAFHSRQGGYVVILNTLIFIMISTFVVYALSNPLLATNRATGNILESKRVFVAANSSMEEVLYKMKNNMTVASFETVTVGGIETGVSVATTFSGQTVQVESVSSDVTRRLQVEVSETDGVSFNYGMQAGRGGFEMYGGSIVYGNLYSNGGIVGYGGATITGSATAANGSDPILHVTNGTVGVPPQEVIFGGQLVSNDKKPEDMAQSFTVSTTTPVTSIRLYIKKYANVWMNDATVRITNNTSGRPGNTTIASATLSANNVTTSYNYLSLPFSSNPVLTPGTTYWLVIDTQNTWDSYYMIGANSAGYAGGVAKTGTYGGSSWANTNPSGLDIYFNLYVGGEVGTINGMQNNRLTLGGDGWAHQISGTDASGALYCQGSSYTNKSCDTSRPDPVQQPFPISDGNIEAWKQEAVAGGTQVGNLTVGNWPTQNVTLGPRKIEGDLRVTSGGTLTVTGTLWVTGNILIDGGAIVKLANSYGSTAGVVVTDGRIRATGGGKFLGNNVTGNYLLLITTSTCPVGSCGGSHAIQIDGGAGAVILNAQKGTLKLSGGAKAKQATAETIIMDGGTEVHYETGLTNMNFNSGPSGTWSVSAWSEI